MRMNHFQESTVVLRAPRKRSDPRTNHFGIAVRAQVLTLREYTSMTIDQVAAATGVKKSEVSNWGLLRNP